MNEPYSAIGRIFEKLNRDCDYPAWGNYIKSLLSKVKSGSIGVDFGCGNGYFTRFLYRQGYIMTGVDISEVMLTTAIQKARVEKIPCEFLLGDIAKLKLREKADFITAINDCMNYIPQERIDTTFRNIHRNLKKGGLFIFDISSEYKLRNLLGNNSFKEDTKDYTYFWDNTLFENYVQFDLTIFNRQADGRYIRKDEWQKEYIHSIDTLKSKAEANGFSVRTEGHLGEPLLDDMSSLPIERQRINFILEKL